MGVAYKVSLFSLDGSTFLRKVKIVVPMARSNGTGAPNSTGQQTTAGPVISAMNTSPGNIYFDAACTIFCGPGCNNTDTAKMASFGFNAIDPVAWMGGASGLRVVFSNGSYIKVTRTVVVGQLRLGFDFCLANDNVVTSGGVHAGLDSTVGRSTNQYEPCSTFPMPLMNVDGTFTDWTARFGGPGIWQYSNNDNRWCFASNGTPNLARISNVSLEQWYEGILPVDEDDPYSNIEDSQPSGPAEGVGIPETAGIDIPALPSVSILDTGFINLFNPTLAQVRSLANYMWSAGFDLNTFKKLFADPMDCVLGFNLVPVDVPSGSAETIVVGNIPTTVSMNVATSQWVELDCGSVNIDKAYGNYLDYAPYSKFSLYLPYIGTVELSTDDLVGRILHLVYHVDVLGCSCVAYLKCGPDTLYQFTGSCGYSIPLTGQNFREMVGAIIDMAVNLGGVMAGGNAVSGIGSIAKDVMNLKPTIHRSGAIGAGAGIMGIQVPYLIMELPNACKPAKQYHYMGYPSFTTVKLGDVSGRQDFESVILDGIPCTEEEREMIAAACAGGIYL